MLRLDSITMKLRKYIWGRIWKELGDGVGLLYETLNSLMEIASVSLALESFSMLASQP